MNDQRAAFKGKVAEHMKSSAADGEHETGAGGGSKTTVEHHGDGTHTIHHADGEKSGPHPSMAHAMMHMTGKHDGGEHGHIMPHPAGATTHHVTMDGAVEGPHEHGSEDEAYNHLKGSIGEGAEMMPEGEMPRMGGGDQDDSGFD